MRGHEVHWFGLKWWSGKSTIEKDGIILHGMGVWNNFYDAKGRRSILEALYFALKTLKDFAGKFDVVDCQEFPYFPIFLAKLKEPLMHFRFFITWYEVWRDYWFDYLGKLGAFGEITEILASKLSSNHIAISEKIKRDLIESLGVPESKVTVVPNGVNFYQIHNNINNIQEENSDVVYVGRLIQHKNVDMLIRAIAKVKDTIPEIKVSIIGSGPQMHYLKKLSSSLGVAENTKFYGTIEDENRVYSIMKGSKIAVLPSSREGFPNVLLEANSCGLPLLTVKHKMNGTSWLVKNGYNGFVLDPSPETLANYIAELLENPNLLARLRDGALEFARNHDWSTIVEKIERVYQNEA